MRTWSAPLSPALFLCGLLVLGRMSHAYGVNQVRESFAFRVSGMAMTFTVILTAAAAILIRTLL